MNQTSTSRDAPSNIDSALQDYEGGNHPEQGCSLIPRLDDKVETTNQKSKGMPSPSTKPSSKKGRVPQEQVALFLLLKLSLIPMKVANILNKDVHKSKRLIRSRKEALHQRSSPLLKKVCLPQQ